jgi:hypothetical protein
LTSRQLADGGPARSLSRPGGGRTWWAHFEFTRINITPTILPKKIEDLREAGARMCQESTLLLRRTENVSDHSVLKFACSGPAARIDKNSDRKTSTTCIRGDIGREVVTRSAATVTVIPAVR